MSEGFFRSRWVEPPAGVEELDPAGLAPGFRAGAASCGLKGGGKTDVGLMVCHAPRVSSSVLLTRNASAAAPVRVCRDRIERRIAAEVELEVEIVRRRVPPKPGDRPIRGSDRGMGLGHEDRSVQRGRRVADRLRLGLPDHVPRLG